MQYIQIILYILFIISVFSFFSLAPRHPTKKNDLDRINDVISFKNGETFLEMWCWTGLVWLYLAKINPWVSFTLVELSPFFYFISKINLKKSWLKNVQIKYWDALKMDLTKYDIIYVFWLPETISKKIFPKLSKIKNKNFRFISYCFKMTNNYFNETQYKPEKKSSIYEYRL